MQYAPALKSNNSIKLNPAGKQSDGVVIGQPEGKTRFTAAAERFLRGYRPILALMTVVCLIGAAWFTYSAYETNIVDMGALLAQKKSALTQRQAELEKLKSTKINFAQLEGPAKKIMEILPLSKELPAIFVAMEALAIKQNLFLAALDVASDQAAESSKKRLPLQKIIINISLTGGDYFALKGFLADVEKNLRLLDVRSLAYAPDTKSFNLSLAAYFFND